MAARARAASEGQGKPFWFKLPLAVSEPTASTWSRTRGVAQVTSPAHAVTAGPGATVHKIRGARVLVAEDNPTNQRVTQMILESGGHIVTIVNNGEAALDALERAKFDLALFDLSMPLVSGLEAMKLYRFTAASPIPVIILSANVTDRGDPRLPPGGRRGVRGRSACEHRCSSRDRAPPCGRPTGARPPHRALRRASGADRRRYRPARSRGGGRTRELLIVLQRSWSASSSASVSPASASLHSSRMGWPSAKTQAVKHARMHCAAARAALARPLLMLLVMRADKATHDTMRITSLHGRKKLGRIIERTY